MWHCVGVLTCGQASNFDTKVIKGLILNLGKT
jgi:hypothetical protein